MGDFLGMICQSLAITWLIIGTNTTQLRFCLATTIDHTHVLFDCACSKVIAGNCCHMESSLCLCVGTFFCDFGLYDNLRVLKFCKLYTETVKGRHSLMC